MAVREILDHQASAIEYLLRTHGIQARVDGGRLSPKLAHFHLMLPNGFNPSRLAPLVPEIANALGVVSCRLAQEEGNFYLEAPRPDPIPVRLLPLVQRVADVVPPITATLGLDTEGTPLLLRLNSPEVDPIMLTGERAAGKSSLIRGMALSMALHNSPDKLRLLLLDCTGERTAFFGLENLPHLACPVATNPLDALASLRWALRSLARRAPALEDDELFFDDSDLEDYPLSRQSSMQTDEPALVIMIDGAGALCSTANKRTKTESLDAMRRLLLAGSAHGIHVVMSAEHPGELMSINTSWGARITGRVDSPETARMATGIKGSGAHGLLGQGDFLVTLNAELIRFQAGAISQQEVGRAVDLIVATCANQRQQPEPEEVVFAHNREQAGAEPQPIRRSWNGD